MRLLVIGERSAPVVFALLGTPAAQLVADEHLERLPGPARPRFGVSDRREADTPRLDDVADRDKRHM